MTTSDIQFHADPEEFLLRLLPKWVGEIDCHIACEEFRAGIPNEYWVGNPTNVGAVRQALSKVDRVYISLMPFKFRSDPSRKLAETNTDLLIALIPSRVPGGLREGAIGIGLTSDEKNLKILRSVMRRSKREMLRGATAVAPSGARRVVPSHLYTHGALALYQSGVDMLAIGGEVRFQLGVIGPID